MICENCEKMIPNDSIICPRCGQKQYTPEERIALRRKAAEAKPQPPGGYVDDALPEEKKFPTNIIIIAGAVAATLLLTIIFIFVFRGRSDSHETATNGAATNSVAGESADFSGVYNGENTCTTSPAGAVSLEVELVLNKINENSYSGLFSIVNSTNGQDMGKARVSAMVTDMPLDMESPASGNPATNESAKMARVTISPDDPRYNSYEIKAELMAADGITGRLRFIQKTPDARPYKCADLKLSKSDVVKSVDEEWKQWIAQAAPARTEAKLTAANLCRTLFDANVNGGAQDALNICYRLDPASKQSIADACTDKQGPDLIVCFNEQYFQKNAADTNSTVPATNETISPPPPLTGEEAYDAVCTRLVDETASTDSTLNYTRSKQIKDDCAAAAAPFRSNPKSDAALSAFADTINSSCDAKHGAKWLNCYADKSTDAAQKASEILSR